MGRLLFLISLSYRLRQKYVLFSSEFFFLIKIIFWPGHTGYIFILMHEAFNDNSLSKS